MPTAYSSNLDQTSYLDPWDAKALNQTKSDKEIVDHIVATSFTTKEMNSAIKIGDVWLSIPAKTIAFWDNKTKVWTDANFDDVGVPAFMKEGRSKGGLVSRDPLEKFTGWQTGAENGVIPDQSIGRYSSGVIENGKSDKILYLTFHCKAKSIQNNIRPLMAQFSVAPFLPIHNYDLCMLVQPHEQHPDVFIDTGLAALDSGGNLVFGALNRRTELQTQVENELQKERGRQSESKIKELRDQNWKQIPGPVKEEMSRFQEKYRRLAYWMAPFYVQLVDYTITSIIETKADIELKLVLRVVDPSPVFGRIPLYLKTEAAVKKQIDIQKRTEAAYKGDNKLIDNLSKMLNIPIDNAMDGKLKFGLNPDLVDYNLYNKDFLDQLNKNTKNKPTLGYTLSLKNKQSQEILNLYNWQNAKMTFRDGALETTYKAYPLFGIVDDKNKNIYPITVNRTEKTLGLSQSVTYNLSKDIASFPNTTKSLYYDNQNNTFRVNNLTNTVNNLTEDLEKYNKEKEKNGYTIFQYNLNTFFGPRERLSLESKKPYEHREATFAWMFYDLKPDILVLQELGPKAEGAKLICDRMNAAISDNKINLTGLKLPYKYYAAPYSDADQAVAVLTRAKVIKEEYYIVESKVAELIKNNVGIKPYIDTFIVENGFKVDNPFKQSRLIQKLTFENGVGNNFVLYNVHLRSKLKAMNEHIRKIEALVIIEDILKLPENMPYVIVGDFNYNFISEANGIRKDVWKHYGLNSSRIEKDNTKYKHIVDCVNNDYPDRPTFNYESILDFLVSFDIDHIKDIANNPNIKIEPSDLIKADKGINFKFFEEFYNKYKNRLDRLVVYPALAQEFKGDIAKYSKTDPDLFKEVISPSGKGTYISKVVEIVGEKSYDRFYYDTIDHILYSNHFFKNASLVKFKENIPGKLPYHRIYDKYNPSHILLTLDDIVQEWKNFVSHASAWRGGQIELALEEGKGLDQFILLKKFVKEIVTNLGGSVTEGIVADIRALTYENEVNPYNHLIWEYHSKNEVYKIKRYDYFVGKFLISENENEFKEWNANEFKYCVVPIEKELWKEVVRMTNYSDHYPVVSTFNWQVNSSIDFDGSPPVYDKTYFYANADSFTNAEIFPIPKNAIAVLQEYYINGVGKPDYSLKTSINNIPTNLVEATNSINSNGINTPGDSIGLTLEGVATNKETTYNNIGPYNNIQLYITGIFYSKINKNYLFFYETTNGVKGVVVNLSSPEEVSENIKALPDQAAKDNILNLFHESYNKAYVERKLDDSQFKPEDITAPIYIGLEKTRIPLPSSIDKLKYLSYFKYDDSIYVNVENIENTDLTPNISGSIAFRYYYLGFLTEFDYALRNKEWRYHYKVDPYEPFLYNWDDPDSNRNIQRLQFHRKLTRKYVRDVMASINEALRVIALLDQGTKEKMSEYLGTIANSLLAGESERIVQIIRTISGSYSATPFSIRTEIIGNQKTNKYDYTNLLASELFFYLATKLTRILMLLDPQEQKDVFGIGKKYEKKTFTITSDLKELRKDYDKTLDIFKEEARYIAGQAVGFSNIQDFNLDREKIAKKLKQLKILNIEIKKDQESDFSKYSVEDNTNKPTFIDKNVATKRNGIGNNRDLLKLEDLADLFKSTRNQYLEYATVLLTDVANPDSRYSFEEIFRSQ